ncbi:UNVERIFIED_CONTAM: Sister-chromatid cohesion protein 3 [Sesamum radiatum]|uniref:Sister-chromatid cohesion protein 3 n=1 Tax=Sesamum radiatum TaxID=300843 RepID=A0AAW2URY4_SESRA
MEDEPVVPEPAARRSKRARAPVRTADFTRTDKIEDELEEEREESSDEFQESRRKIKRNKATEEVIKGDGKDIPDVVKRWVEQYERNQKSAMSGLLSMLFEACGAKYRLHEEDVDETDVDDVVVALVNMARRGEVEDYQSSKRDFKNFKDNLVYFWDNLVSECQNGPLFDQSLFDKCLDYIIALSCTPPRSYRQIASLMGLQLVTSFINVAKLLGSQRETTQRQLNAEKKKKIEGPRVESLSKRLSMTHEKITTMEEMMRKIFTGLFCHRYRDIDPDIRVSCIESLGVWVLSYPSLFLQDLYLKYLGWTLNDKSAGVRKASILALQNLYEADDNVPSLNLFTERFYPRMLELADDIDISVSVCAIGLVKQLLRHQLVPDEELGSLYDLLIDDPPDVRRAIGALVYDHLIAQKFNDSQSRSTGSDNDSSEVHISRMLQILKEFSADPILSSYVIDDVWDYMAAMKNGGDEYSLLVNLKRSYEFQLSDKVPLESLYQDLVHILQSFKNIDDELLVPNQVVSFLLLNMFLHVSWCLHSVLSSETVSEAALSSLVEKRDALLEQLEYFLHNPLKLNSDGRCKNQLAYRAYQRYLVVNSSGNDESLSSKSFQECKDLAVRLSGSYVGVARNKYKAEILSIVREGINYAFSHAPKQLSFLDNVVLHFVSKLPATDILDIMRGVERRTENVKTDEDPSGWRAYYTFLDTLREKYLKNEGVKDGKEGTSVRRRGRPRKKQNLQGKRLFDEQSSSEEEDSISGSDQDAGVEEKQEDDEEDAPLIHSLRASSKLRSIRVSKEENRDQTRTVDRATEELATPKTSGDALPDPESPGTWSGSGRTQTHLLEAEIRMWEGENGMDRKVPVPEGELLATFWDSAEDHTTDPSNPNWLLVYGHGTLK